MGLKDTLLGWMRQSDQAGESTKAEEDLVEREYGSEKTDRMADLRFGTSGDHFDADESAPPR